MLNVTVLTVGAFIDISTYCNMLIVVSVWRPEFSASYIYIFSRRSV